MSTSSSSKMAVSRKTTQLQLRGAIVWSTATLPLWLILQSLCAAGLSAAALSGLREGVLSALSEVASLSTRCAAQGQLNYQKRKSHEDKRSKQKEHEQKLSEHRSRV